MEFRLDCVDLRSVTQDDLNEVARMWNFEKGEISLEEAAKAIDRMTENHRQNRPHKVLHLCLAVFEKDTNRIIGWCGLDGRTNAVNIFYLIDRNHRGRGYATACAKKLLEYGFLEMELDRIDGACANDNIGSQKILKKIGMRKTEQAEHVDDGSLHYFMTYQDYSGGRIGG